MNEKVIAFKTTSIYLSFLFGFSFVLFFPFKKFNWYIILLPIQYIRSMYNDQGN
jgi:hypothetical protein